jgi:hypothetical protein
VEFGAQPLFGQLRVRAACVLMLLTQENSGLRVRAGLREPSRLLWASFSDYLHLSKLVEEPVPSVPVVPLDQVNVNHVRLLVVRRPRCRHIYLQPGLVIHLATVAIFFELDRYGVTIIKRKQLWVNRESELCEIFGLVLINPKLAAEARAVDEHFDVIAEGC